jgi:alpha-L-fucosidase
MQAASKAGFAYAVLTTRHHDGYCLFPSEHGEWDTGDQMEGRDLVKGYVEACRKHGLRTGFYYSGPNWHFDYKNKDFSHPPQGINYRHEKVENDPPLAALMGYTPPLPGEGDRLEQEESTEQVRELMTNYGPIDLMWWDGNLIMTEEELAKLQPDIFVARGNIATPEGRHHGLSRNVKITNEAGWWWELCIKPENKDTPNWHYSPVLEKNHWNAGKLLSELVRCRSLGGNLLVNVPPRPNGEMMDWFYAVCDEMAGWMKHSREAVVEVDLDPPLPTLDKTENYTTVKGSTWYSQPDSRGALLIHGVEKPLSVTLLRTGDRLESEFRDGTLRVVVPESMRTELPDLVKLVFKKG